jgi:hypothetical protein
MKSGEAIRAGGRQVGRGQLNPGVHSTFLGNLLRFLNLDPNLNLQMQEGGIKIKIRIKIKRGTQKYEMHP